MSRFDSLLLRSCTLSGVLLLVLAVFIVLDVLGRWALGRPITGVFETSEVAFVLVTFFALGWTHRQGRQMRIDIVSGRVRGRPAHALEAVANLLALAFFGMVLWRAGTQWLEAWRIWDVRPGLVQIPTIIPIGAIIAGTVLLGLTLLAGIVTDVRRLLTGAPGPPPAPGMPDR